MLLLLLKTTKCSDLGNRNTKTKCKKYPSSSLSEQITVLVWMCKCVCLFGCVFASCFCFYHYSLSTMQVRKKLILGLNLFPLLSGKCVYFYSTEQKVDRVLLHCYGAGPTFCHVVSPQEQQATRPSFDSFHPTASRGRESILFVRQIWMASRSCRALEEWHLKPMGTLRAAPVYRDVTQR